jgi:GMP synthase-like glutamine amidotransferase
LLEFVRPVENILKSNKVEFLTRNYLSIKQCEVDKATKVIICGTALKDFNYLENIDKFNWVEETDKPFFGICAGMQILAKLQGCKVFENERIGRYRVNLAQNNGLSTKKILYSYFLNSMAVEPNQHFETVGDSEGLKCIIVDKQRKLYGCLFHPEVLNPEIIADFSSQSSP